MKRASATSRHAAPELPLDELVVDGFDAEQIWAELQLQHEPLISALEAQVRYMEANKPTSGKDAQSPDASSDESSNSDSDGSGDDDDMDGLSEEDGDAGEGSDDDESEPDVNRPAPKNTKQSKSKAAPAKRGVRFEQDEDDDDADDDEISLGDDAGDDSDEVDDMEAFLREGDAEMARILAEKRGDRVPDDADGNDEEDDDDDDSDHSFDINAPIPDDDDADAAASKTKGGNSSKGTKNVKLQRTLSDGLRYQDVFGSAPPDQLDRAAAGNGKSKGKGEPADDDDDDAAEDDETEEEDGDDDLEATDAAFKNEAQGGKGGRYEKENIGFDDQDEDWLDSGMGVDDKGDEDDDDEEDEEEGAAGADEDDDDEGDGELVNQSDDEDDEEAEGDDADARAKRRRALLEDDGSEGGDAEDGDDSDGGNQVQRKLTSHELEKQRLASQIKQLEDRAMGDKAWEMKGEVASKQRPENSLLAAELEYQQAVKSAPQVTVETTAALEDLIRQRVADMAFDDPIQKTEPAPDASSKKELPELSVERSKDGLGDVYAAQYAERALGVSAQDEKTKALEAEVDVALQKVFNKLDSLTNYQFTPKAVIRDMSVKSNVPAIAMEEALPLAVSSAAAVAPEEVHARKTGRAGILKSAGEKSSTEREADRRAKKRSKRKEKAMKDREQRMVEKVNPGLGNPYSKAKALAEVQRQAAAGSDGHGTKVSIAGEKRGRDGAVAGSNTEYSGAAASSGSSGRLTNSTALFQRLQDEADQVRAKARGEKQLAGGAGHLAGGKAKGPKPGSAAAKLKM